MYYYVQPGDSMHSIAIDHNTTVRHLMDLNPQIRNPHRLHVGERITVSSGYHWGGHHWGGNQWGRNEYQRGRDEFRRGHEEFRRGHEEFQRGHAEYSKHRGR